MDGRTRPFFNTLLMIGAALVISNLEGRSFSTVPCNATAPCHCGASYISCSSLALDTLPAILPFDHHVSSLTIYLQDNNLTRLENGVFQNISAMNASKITFDISNNSLEYIDQNAFNGIEHAIVTLNLEKNRLTSLPLAFASLSNIKMLLVSENPLKSLDAHILAGIGNSLEAFYVDLQNVPSWPYEMHLLRALQTLSIQNLNAPYIPYNGFAGHGINLQHLEISNSHLEYVPSAICQLTNLLDFTFTANHFLDQNIPLFEPCPHNLHSVASVNLQMNSLQTFPAGLFDVFPNVRQVNLENNDLYYIREQDILNNSSLNILNLNSNKFTRIPSVLNKFSNMNFLSMENNDIQTIDSPLDIPSLRVLMLNGNPIIYIQPEAFNHMGTALSRIYLLNTNLDHIPEAFTRIPSLNHLDITGRKMDCTCMSMDYLRTWNVDNIVMLGTECEISDEPVKHYLQNSLPNCP